MKFYIWLNEAHQGPYDPNQIMIKLQDGVIDLESLCIPDDGSIEEWFPVGELPGMDYSYRMVEAHDSITRLRDSDELVCCYECVSFNKSKHFVYDALVNIIKSNSRWEVEHENRRLATVQFSTGTSLFSWGENIKAVILPGGKEECVLHICSFTTKATSGLGTQSKNSDNVKKTLGQLAGALDSHASVWLNNKERYFDPDDELFIYPNRSIAPLENIEFVSLRDELIGKSKFTEKYFDVPIPLEILSDKTIRHFNETGMQHIIQRNAQQIEISAGTPDFFQNNKANPDLKIAYNVCIASSGSGVRISFIRTRAIGALMKDGFWVTANALLSLPVAAVVAAAYAGIHVSDKHDESLYWSFIESKINELKSAYPQAASGALPATDISSQIEKLWNLTQLGALTQAEFEQQKKILLSS
jgi:hypothetical protein